MSDTDSLARKGKASSEDNIIDPLAPSKVELSSKMELPEMNQDESTLNGIVQLQVNDSDDDDSESQTNSSKTLSHTMKIEDSLSLNMTEARDAESKLSILSGSEQSTPSSPALANAISSLKSPSFGNEQSTPSSPALANAISSLKSPSFGNEQSTPSSPALANAISSLKSPSFGNEQSTPSSPALANAISSVKSPSFGNEQSTPSSPALANAISSLKSPSFGNEQSTPSSPALANAISSLKSPSFGNEQSTPSSPALANAISSVKSPSFGNEQSTPAKPVFTWRRADEFAHATVDILRRINADLCKNKDLRKIQELYQTEIHRNPRNVEILRAYSCFLAGIGERNSAEKYLQEALQINPRSLESSISYAELLLAGIDYKRRFHELQKAEMLLLRIQDIFPDNRRIQLLLDRITSTISKHDMSMFVSSSGFLNIQGKKDRQESMPSFTPQRRRAQISTCFNMLKEAVSTFEEELSNIKHEEKDKSINPEKAEELKQKAEERLNRVKLECLREDMINKDSNSKPFSFEHDNDSSKGKSERDTRKDEDDEDVLSRGKKKNDKSMFFCIPISL
ncbi:hypothetical protein GUITHDRAFT_113058 [Guillardia theta CCMP2712]|uniref:Uncharacterized protein n=1 Tax=Guillardia theta (strain CCMP2712) TaxID=905079 RepID=L1IX54_GUITC|nr:hypothetical protein GUITHDRAFT_113058 [Guillardia theta CCMP2712]EKX40791.1 hypothetical protein GUITHDRAFT_113058 [Guillardia theta CCMP2712]|eukprot:XP_005827771.1 hypothetical protein GUITHDRAFT_113058 [Guillardia theta CCMP2712]